jgi:hypothetical protein
MLYKYIVYGAILSKFVSLSSIEKICTVSGNFCLQPRNPGGCQPANGLASRFGYNPATDTCVEFKYTGCDGNLNNFNSPAECSNICCNKGYNLLRLRDSPDGEGSGEAEELTLEAGNSTANATIPLLDLQNDEIEQTNRTRTRAVVRRGGWMDLLRFW